MEIVGDKYVLATRISSGLIILKAFNDCSDVSESTYAKQPLVFFSSKIYFPNLFHIFMPAGMEALEVGEKQILELLMNTSKL